MALHAHEAAPAPLGRQWRAAAAPHGNEGGPHKKPVERKGGKMTSEFSPPPHLAKSRGVRRRVDPAHDSKTKRKKMIFLLPSSVGIFVLSRVKRERKRLWRSGGRLAISVYMLLAHFGASARPFCLTRAPLPLHACASASRQRVSHAHTLAPSLHTECMFMGSTYSGIVLAKTEDALYAKKECVDPRVCAIACARACASASHTRTHSLTLFPRSARSWCHHILALCLAIDKGRAHTK